MLAAAQRLRRRTEFATTIRRGVRVSRGAVVVHLIVSVDHQTPASLLPETRRVQVGFVVSRAVGGAVDRNRVKRQLRQVVRSRLDLLPDGSALVVRALPAAAGRGSARLGADLDAAVSAAVSRVRR